MLKQSLYLYDNNVTVYFSPETGGFTTNRSSKVYDRKLNFFKGIDNTVLFSFKNDDQKPVGITGKTIYFNLMDPENKTTTIQKTMTIKDGGKGIAQLKIAEDDLLDKPAKFYTYSVHIKDEEDNELPVYSDTRYMPGGTAEVMENIYPEFVPSVEITSFTKRNTQLISSTIDAAPELNSNSALHSIAVYTTDFTGRFEIFGTMDASVSLATDALQVGDSDKYKNFFVITPDGESNPYRICSIKSVFVIVIIFVVSILKVFSLISTKSIFAPEYKIELADAKNVFAVVITFLFFKFRARKDICNSAVPL